MEEYLVSARKYRPATFDSVVGQRALTTTLLNAIRLGKLAHAYLFCGPRGVGKTTCARIFAKTINCMNPGPNMEACNECESCRAFDEGRSMNIHELDAASNNSVDDMRELIKQVQIPPQIGRYKVFIIDEVHMLSTAAFNAFLKTLEEPPHYAIFILATTEKHKILPTILSRCQVYDFQRMTMQNTIEHLRYVAQKEGVEAEDEALMLVAQKADGGMRDALSIFDQMVSFCGGKLTYQQALQNLGMLDSDYYFRLVDHFLQHEVEPCLLLLDEVIRRGFDAGNFINGLSGHLRDVLVARDAETLALLETSEQMKLRYQEQANRCQPRFLYRAIKLCNECDQAYRTSRNKRLQVEICLIECAQEDDILPLGRRPRILKQLFNFADEQRLQAKDAPAAQTKAQQSVATANNQPATQAPPQANTLDSQKDSQAATPRQAAKPAPLRTISLSNLPSIKRPYKPADLTSSTQEDATKGLALTIQEGPKPSAGKEDRQENEATVTQPSTLPFNEHNVMLCWQEYATRLPQEHRATSQRMRAITPRMTGENQFTITVNNAQVKKEMEFYAPYIRTYFEQRMANPNVQMEVEVAEAQTLQNTFTKPEIFRRMTKRNPNIKQLADALDLEIE